jgi:amidase
MGDKWTEEALIGFAYAYEQRTHIRNKIQPFVQPNTQLVDVVGTYLNMSVEYLLRQ